MKLAIFVPFILLLLACSEPNRDYFPLGESIKWEYHIEKQLGHTQNVGKSIIAQLDSVETDGADYFPYHYANGETLFYSKDESGILLSPQPDSIRQMFIKFPLERDTYWSRETRIELLNSRHESFAGGESFISQGEKIILHNKIVSFDETISVPAGIFRETMRIDSVVSVEVKERTRGIDAIHIEQSEWYARGVGLVKRVRSEVSIPEKYDATETTVLIRYEHD